MKKFPSNGFDRIAVGLVLLACLIEVLETVMPVWIARLHLWPNVMVLACLFVGLYYAYVGNWTAVRDEERNAR